ncbi:DUF2167 domain-containing protein [Massilia glaciei]|uniref:DUF2167 domain-containing protein n=1 Tax=Massilia glaciei TaxID=1524097 RepID=A0A2U2HH83_9BURK|nr:DUF2167 domain-containing protein [Massilia glaciei]PWF45022.1 DUF2167 domain-containing protein [Massilia glaciei]
MLKKLLLVLSLCAFLPGVAHADAPAEAKMTEEQFLAKLNFQQGKINLGGGVASLDLPATFRYLGAADTERLLVEGWGNMPGNTTLGMIVPAGVSPLSEAGWGVIVTFDKDGHVKDDDADSIKYDELLKTMQEETAAASEERKKAGYDSMALVGWAEKPSYDKASHKLFWAKELKTGNNPQNSLNYNIRVLGREGVLVLNAVAGMHQIDTIKKEMKHVTAFTEFSPGNRYADFNEKTDRVAEYGIAALVAGGLAAKMGLFAKLLAFLLLFKKFVIIGVIAIGAALLKWFGNRKAKVKVSLEK